MTTKTAAPIHFSTKDAVLGVRAICRTQIGYTVLTDDRSKVTCHVCSKLLSASKRKYMNPMVNVI